MTQLSLSLSVSVCLSLFSLSPPSISLSLARDQLALPSLALPFTDTEVLIQGVPIATQCMMGLQGSQVA